MNQEELKQRLIDLIAKARASMRKESGLNCDLARNYYFAEFLIANGATIRERGEWEMQKYPLTQCSVCKTSRDCEHDNGWDFCPHCGADMRGVKDE